MLYQLSYARKRGFALQSGDLLHYHSARSAAAEPRTTLIIAPGGRMAKHANKRIPKLRFIEAVESGVLHHKRTGCIRYARLSDVLAWEERRLRGAEDPNQRRIDADVEDLA